MSEATFLHRYARPMFQFGLAIGLLYWYYHLAKNEKHKGFWPNVLLAVATVYIIGVAVLVYRKTTKGDEKNTPKNGVSGNTGQSTVVNNNSKKKNNSKKNNNGKNQSA